MSDIIIRAASSDYDFGVRGSQQQQQANGGIKKRLQILCAIAKSLR